MADRLGAAMAACIVAHALIWSVYSYAEAFGLTPCIDGRWGWGPPGVCAHPDQRGRDCACEDRHAD